VALVHNLSAPLRAASFTFSNTNSLSISDFPLPTEPYPSSITVTGLPGVVLKKVTIQLHGFSHTFPDDVDMLLVGPGGQDTVFFSNVGGGCDATNLSITLDDDASVALTSSCLSSGTFHPTNRLSGDTFPGPAPAPTGASDFSVFQGTDPNGTWHLYVADDASSDSGSLTGGWSLTLSADVLLEMQILETNVVLSWPASADNCLLQSSPSLSDANAWSPLPALPVETAGRLTVTNAIAPGLKFYRLVESPD
jgi:hypothetical protein